MAKHEVAKVTLELSSDVQTAIAQIEGILEQSKGEVANVGSGLAAALTTARTIQAIRNSITPEMMKDVMALQGTSLGFKTDKDRSGGYPEAVVKDCLIEGLMRGIRPFGNEMNIISGRCYMTREALTRLLREYPGLTDLRIVPSVPQIQGGRAIVHMEATWRLNGEEMSLQRDIPIRVNDGMIDDAILGKADRKMKKSIYELLTGSEITDGEVGDVITVQPEPPRGAVSGADLTAGAKTIPPRKSSAELANEFADRMKAANSREELATITEELKKAKLSSADLEVLRALYAERNAELVE